jgi:hypothetical protein
MPITALGPGTLRVAPGPASYLVVACRPGKVARLTCRTVRAAATAARTYRKWGWAVVVLPELP